MSDELELPEPTEIKVLQLQPGDRLIVRYRQKLSHQTVDALRTGLKTRWPDVDFLVMDADPQIDILRPPMGEAVAR